MTTVAQTAPSRKPQVYRLNRGVRYATPTAWPAAQVATELLSAFGADAYAQALALAGGATISTVFARYSLDAEALAPTRQAPPARPLWAHIADPATYNGSYGRDLVKGR